MFEDLKILSREVIAIQQKLVEQETLHRLAQKQNEQQLRTLMLDILDLVDLVSLASKPDMSHEVQYPFVKKIAMRLDKLLRKYQILEIDTLVEGVQVGKVKVVGTQRHSQETSGEILSIVRKGYTWNSNTLRPAEVITAEL